MNVPADMQARILDTQGELQSVRARIATLEQSKKVLALTENHVNSKEAEITRVWRGVGKMFISESKEKYSEDTAEQIKSYDEQVSALRKKETYFKTTLDNMVQAVTS